MLELVLTDGVLHPGLLHRRKKLEPIDNPVSNSGRQLDEEILATQICPCSKSEYSSIS
jgi:hypothetical protein